MSCHYSRRIVSPNHIGWLIPLLLVGASIGCKSEKEPLTSADSKFEVADDEQSDEEAAATEAESSVIEQPNRLSTDDTATSESPTLSELDATAAPVDSNPITPPAGRNGGGDTQSSVNNTPRNPRNSNTSERAALNTPRDQADATENGGTETVELAPPVVSQESLESLTPPEGPPEAIWQFIVQLDERKPRGRTDREIMADIQRILAARIQAAELILQNKQADAKLRRDSVDVKLTSLQGLVQLGIPEAREHLLAFAQGLRRDADPEIAGMGRLLSFTMLVNRVVDGQVGEAQPVVAAAQQLLKEEPDGVPNKKVLTQVCTAAVTLMEAGFLEDGKQLVDVIDKKYSGTGDKEVEELLGQLADETHFQDLGLSKKLQEFAEGKQDTLPALTDATREFLDRPNPGIGRLQRALYIGEALERKQEVSAAKDVYQHIGSIFQDDPDPQLSKVVKETVLYAERRMSLLDHPLTVEGTLQDGSKLNWADYQGKVVLVNFWATSNFQYLQQEMQALKGLLDIYRDHGFAILSINVDVDRDLVTRFLQFQPLPWPTVLDGTEGNRAMLEKCGVSSVPFNLLIDQTGKVIELHTNATSLRDKLVTMLGTPDTSPPDGREQPKEQTGAIQRANHARNSVVAYFPVQDQPGAQPEGDVSDTKSAEPTSDQQPAEEARTAQPTKEINPYSAPADLDRAGLAEFLLKMEEKPKSIRERPGFDDALLDAADRILAQSSDGDTYQAVALDVKLRTLHRQAISEVDGAEDQLWQLVQSLDGKAPERVAKDVEMLALEHQLLGVDELPIEQVPPLLDKVHEFLSSTPVVERHTRLASATVHAINRLDVKEREPNFQRFGQLFSKSSDRRLASYGRRIAEMEVAPNVDLVGKELELSGATALGVEFDWAAYRGKVVLVDFWATWCGPCRTEMPLVKMIWEKYRDRGFDVVGINLDKDVEQLGKYLDEQVLQWNNVVGDGARDAATRYEIQGIPTMALVGRDGKVVAVAHSSTELIAKIEELLQ